MKNFFIFILVVFIAIVGLWIYKPEWFTFIPADRFQNSDFVQDANNYESAGEGIFIRCPAGWEFNVDVHNLTFQGENLDHEIITCIKNKPEYNIQNFLVNNTINISTRAEAEEVLNKSIGTFDSSDMEGMFPGKADIGEVYSDNEIGFDLGDLSKIAESFGVKSTVTYYDTKVENKIENGFIISISGEIRTSIQNMFDETAALGTHVIVCDNGIGRLIRQSSMEDSTISATEIAKSFSCKTN